MSREKYSDDCPGCRPVMLDVKTGEPLPNDHPAMKATLRAWKTLTREEREAWHRTTCLNSRDPLDLAICDDFMHRIKRQTAAH